MELPLVATFEIPVSENGELPERLEAVFPSMGQRFEKNFFGCMTETAIADAVKAIQLQLSNRFSYLTNKEIDTLTDLVVTNMKTVFW